MIDHEALKLAAEKATEFGVGMHARKLIPDADLAFIDAANPATVLALLAEREQMAARIAELEKAQRFAGMVLNAHRNDGYPSDVDGGSLEGFANQCGMIEARNVTEPCGDTCTCSEVMVSDDWPTVCFFDTEAGKAAMSAAPTPGGE